MDEIVRKQEDIDDVLNAASDGVENGSSYPGMSFEQGIQDMYLWLTGQSEDNPMEL